MNSAVLLLISLVCLLLAYRYWGRYLNNRVFGLDKETGPTPATSFQDDVDYVPTKKSILFGHHYSSIAGAAPIVGPAVAAIWGWVPAFLWILVGVIFMGATHDFGALVVSMKNKGESIGKVAENVIGVRVRTLFLVVIFFLVWMVIAVFTLVIANLFIAYPSSVIPINFEIIVAVLMGFLINRKKANLLIPSVVAQVVLLFMIYLGTLYPISLSDYFGGHELMVWMLFLLLYCFIASILPVWVLLQPRDYINGHQLFLGLGLMIAGVFVVRPEIVAPAVNFSPEGAPPWFPFLFITIACGAISGFHGLVSGGTTSKQVEKWQDAKAIGYGGMLGEGLLAILATLAVCTGFSGREAWHAHYGNWSQVNGLSAQISAFVQGAGKFLSGLGLQDDFSNTVIAVLIISFAATSLDTACRIQRYIIEELGQSIGVKVVQNRFVSSGLAVLTAFLLIVSDRGGKGGLQLWPLFGATNQMLACLTLIVISVYLFKNGRSIKAFAIPGLLLFVITTVGLYFNITSFIESKSYFLSALATLLILTQLWIAIESFSWMKKRNGTNP